MKVIKKFLDIDPCERYLLFTDGSYQEHTSPTFVGLGAELRNSLGEVVLVYSEQMNIRFLESGVAPMDSEKVALKQALTVCKNEGVQKIIVNTDCDGMATKLNQYIEAKELNREKQKEMKINAKLSNLYLFNCVDMFEEFFIEHIPRDLNKNADFYSRATEDVMFAEKIVPMPFSGNSELEKVVKKNKKQVELEDKEEDSVIVDTSIKILDISKHKMSEENKKLNQTMYVEFNDIEVKNELHIRVFFEKDDIKDVNEFKFIHIKYNQQNKSMIMLFVLHNLVAENSTISLLQKREGDDTVFEYFYNNTDWLSFDNLNLNKRYYKTFISMSKKLLIYLNKRRSKWLQTIVEPENYLAFVQTVYNNQASYFIGYTNNPAILYVGEKSVKQANEKSRLINERVALEYRRLKARNAIVQSYS
jgi:ribonuclease HI